VPRAVRTHSASLVTVAAAMPAVLMSLTRDGRHSLRGLTCDALLRALSAVAEDGYGPRRIGD
jgi:hypothetical protein